jgi:hypothetical protein
MVESGWRQFCVPTTPSDQVGGASRTIISFDCGYGIGQVTSGMHVGETPNFDRALVASDPTYNLATGTLILASKWTATNCVGDNQPTIVEDWYTAVWAYNGLAYSNNPSNPNYDSARGVYNPAVNNACPYQERVFGYAEYPPNGYWTSVALAYPDRADCGTSGAPPDLPEPHCASPTDCVNTRSVHVSNCLSSNTTTTSSTASTGGGPVSSATAGGAPGNTSATAQAGAGVTSGNAGAGGSPGNQATDKSIHGTVCGCRIAGDPSSDDAASWAAFLFGVAFTGARLRRRRLSTV